MSFLIDTNIISEIQKGGKANPGVIMWFSDVNSDELFTSVLVIGEIIQGIESLRRRDSQQAAILGNRIRIFQETMGNRILPVTLQIAQRWAINNVPDRISVIDGLLAATAIEHNLIFVTRNIRDVERTNVRLLNPFEN